jgi:FkbM family methyltransferase
MAKTAALDQRSPALSAAADRRQLTSLLDARIRSFETHGVLAKLASRPLAFAVSEFSKRFHRDITTQITTFWGGRMNVVLPEPVSLFLYRYGYFEKELTTLLLQTLNAGDSFMDVGSHFGYFSLLAAHLVGDRGRVVAFEPTPRTFRLLQSNTAAEPSIRAENLAAWSQPMTLELVDLGAAWSSHNSLFAPKMVPAGAKVTVTKHQVKAVAVDDYLREHQFSPTLMKIDAESAELEILKGMSETLSRCRPIVTLEVGDDGSAVGAVRSTDAVRYCRDFDYLPFAYEDGRIVAHEIKDTYTYDNIFMFPRERQPSAS